MYVCMYVCMAIFHRSLMRLFPYTFILLIMYVCMYVCMYACMYVGKYLCHAEHRQGAFQEVSLRFGVQSPTERWTKRRRYSVYISFSTHAMVGILSADNLESDESVFHIKGILDQINETMGLHECMYTCMWMSDIKLWQQWQCLADYVYM